MSADVPPPPPELAALFEGERGYEEVPDANLRARVLAGVRLRVAPPGDGGDPGGGSPGGAGAASGGTSVATSTAVAGMIATFVVGALLGAAVMYGRAPSPVAAPAPAAPSFAPTPVVAPPPSLTVTAEPPPPAATSLAAPSSSPPVVKPASSSAEDARSAAAERALLDAARIALASGEAAQALDVVERHGREYPHGRLAEEREAIAVRALVKAGRHDEARARAARFQSVYPRSVAAPAVSAAIHSIP